MIDAEKLFLPLGIVAAIGTVYLLFKGDGSQTATVTYPNPAPSGVSQAQTSQGAIQPVTYDVAPVPAMGPATIYSLGGPQVPGGYGPAYQITSPASSQDAALANPGSSIPGGKQPSKAPAYLTRNFFNMFGPSKPKPAPDAGCGCDSCASKPVDSCSTCVSGPNAYSDGRGNVALASSRASLVRHTHGQLLNDVAENINGYLSLYDGGSNLPNLTSNPRSGSLAA